MEYMAQKTKKSLEALPESDTIISDKYQITIPPVVLPQSLTTTVYQTDHIQVILQPKVCCRPRKFVPVENVVGRVNVQGPEGVTSSYR